MSKVGGLALFILASGKVKNLRLTPADQGLWLQRLPIAFQDRHHLHFYFGLRRAINDFKPDIINIEEEHYSLVTWQVMEIARRLRVPAVFYSWQNIKKLYPPPFCFIERRIFKLAAAGIAGNKEAATIVKEKGFRRKMTVIPQMGVDLRPFATLGVPDPRNFTHGPTEDFAASLGAAKRGARQSLGCDTDAALLGYVGRLVDEKGLTVLIDAMKFLQRNKLQRNNLQLIILGSGPMHRQLSRQIESCGLQRCVRLQAQVPSAEVARWLTAFDGLILPSLTRTNWKEQFGRVLTEAMAAGCVTIGSDSGEIPEVIGTDELIAKEGDSESLARTISAAFSHHRSSAQLAWNGLLRVRNLYSNEVIAKKFLDTFQEILVGS